MVFIRPSLHLTSPLIKRAIEWGKTAGMKEVFIVPDLEADDDDFVLFLGQINDEWHGGFYKRACDLEPTRSHYCWPVFQRSAKFGTAWLQRIMQPLSETFQAYTSEIADGES